eukprot:scaffold50519_cov60-Phaeocystis_antarctica.AAC.1
MLRDLHFSVNLALLILTANGNTAKEIGTISRFGARPPSRPLGSLTPTQPGRVTDPDSGLPWATLGSPPQAECWLLRREPKPPA